MTDFFCKSKAASNFYDDMKSALRRKNAVLRNIVVELIQDKSKC